MRIHLINPNTSAGMTATMAQTASLVKADTTEIVASQPESGPVSIESHFDEALSVVGILEEIRKSEAQATDAYIIGCFGDPGLLAARELTRAPVVGIAEAAFHCASLISTRFSIVTTMDRTRIIAEHLLAQYGFREHCRQIRAINLPVLDLEQAKEQTYTKLLAECRQARDTDGIGAIVLGCGGMSDLTEPLSHELGIPVIEGVSAAVKLCEALVSLKLGTSKFGDLAFPPAKRFTGKFADWSEA